MPTKLWTYFLGGTIVDSEVLARVQEYENLIHILQNKGAVTKPERHITIVPPFLADYETASRINIGCMTATIFSKHPLTSTLFQICDLTIMTFEGLEILCFPVEVHTGDTKDGVFIDYVKALRQKLISFGIQYKEKIPEEYKPHITVCIGENLSKNEDVQSLITKSKQDNVIRFRSGYPTLYTKTKEGWGDLSNDPNP